MTVKLLLSFWDNKLKLQTYIIRNADFEGSNVALWESSLNPEIASYRTLYAHELVEANEEGKLKGRLKEIASTLDEEDNPVIMLMKQKRN